MSIRCGHCRKTHNTVAEVRECASIDIAADRFIDTNENLSPKKQDYLRDLLGQFYLSLTGDLTPETIDYVSGSKILGALIDARRNKTMGKPFTFPDGVQMMPHTGRPRERTAKQAPLPDVPQGHYAIASLTGSNDLDFFRVDRPEKGTWAGRTFVKRVIGGRPDTNIRGKEARQVLQAILDFGPEDAGIIYGTQLGRCCRCNRHLTDELSRTIGMGPECRSKS